MRSADVRNRFFKKIRTNIIIDALHKGGVTHSNRIPELLLLIRLTMLYIKQPDFKFNGYLQGLSEILRTVFLSMVDLYGSWWSLHNRRRSNTGQLGDQGDQGESMRRHIWVRTRCVDRE
jgi:hypothetical protein